MLVSLPSGPCLCPCEIPVVQGSVRDVDSLLPAPVCCGGFTWVSEETQCYDTQIQKYIETAEEGGTPIQTLNWGKMGVSFLSGASLHFTRDHSEPGSQSSVSSKIDGAFSESTFTPDTLMPRCCCGAHPTWGLVLPHHSSFVTPLH